MQIAVINKSTHISAQNASLMVQACNKQLASHIAPAWGKIAMPVVLYANELAVPTTAQKVVILDNSDQADALGYHTEENSKVFARVFVNPVLDNGGVVLFDPKHPQNVSVSSVLSHEIAEMFIDPFVNLWADGPSIDEGSVYAIEVGDPVESDSYTISVQIPPATKGGSVTTQLVSVSNFVFPEWFDDEAPFGSRFDQMNRVHSAFTMSAGGYMIVRLGPGSEQAVFGDKTRPTTLNPSKSSPMSRTFKRGVIKKDP